MTARTSLNDDGTAIAFDPVQGSHAAPTKGVLMSIEGPVPGNVLNCALIPIDRIRAVIASLELVAKQVRA